MSLPATISTWNLLGQVSDTAGYIFRRAAFVSQAFILKGLKIHKRRSWDKDEGEGKPRIRQVVNQGAVVDKLDRLLKYK